MTDGLSGRRLDGYELRERIGRGGMASVYRAWQASVGREVALKVLSADLGEASEYPARFEREVRVSATLEHPAILPVYDHGVAEDVSYIVMRLLTGGSLAERLRDGPMPPAEALRILERVAGGLDHAHGRGVVHRDLKPGNILFDEAGNPYISDFGIARLIDAGSVMLTSEVAIGTPHYISPEQASSGKVDGRADQYALAVIAYEMLAGAPPFTGATAMSVLLAHVQAEPRQGDLPGPIFEVLRRGLAKAPEERYATATEFVRALRRAVRAAGMPVTLTFPVRPVDPAQPRRVPPPAPGVRSPSPVSVRGAGSGVVTAVPVGPAVLELLGLTAVVGVLIILVNVVLPGPGIPWLPVLAIALTAWAVARFQPRLRELLGGSGMRARAEVSGAAEAAGPLRDDPPAAETSAPVSTPSRPAYVLSTVHEGVTPETTQVPADPAEILTPGQMFAEYRIEERLDEGNRTRVYHAFDTRRERHVALKVIGRNRAGSTRTARFRQEARLLGRLHHAHIVPFFDFGTLDTVNYIVTPLLPGRSLATRLREGRPMGLDAVIQMVEQVGGALDYLHAQGVVHRDLKPTNLVFDANDNVYLADLGIAKVLNEPEDLNLTGAGQPIGTPAYMAPEQWLGVEVLPATDQYALGCITYEALSGAPPFHAENPFALMLSHVRETPEPLSSPASGLHPGVDDVLQRALEKDPARRFATIGEFADALRETILPPPVDVDARRSGHVFISYCQVDGDYAYRLADEIRSKGFDVWIDSRIAPADHWWRTIVAALDGCSAFVPVMTPRAAESRWVEREVLLADRHGKPAFPLLLEGDAFPIYVSTQYTDVTGGRMPPDSFYARLSEVVKRG